MTGGESPRPLGIDGRVWALVAASALGLNTSLASLAYDTGATPLLLVAVRTLTAAALLGAWLHARRTGLTVRPADLPAIFLATCGTMGVSICYMSSVFFIPVSLAAIIFYTFPLVVALAQALLARRMPALRDLLLFVMAFVGLVLAIGPSFQSLDIRGIGLASLASLSSAMLFLVAERKLAHVDDLKISFNVNLIGGASLVLVVSVFFGDLFQLPRSEAGYGLTVGICAAYLIGVTTLFTALRSAGASSAALLFNIEPLVSIAMAFALLGERFSALQSFGGALVIVALVVGSLKRKRHAAPPLPGRPI